MQINWVTFIAQIVNFLILLYLLKRFLFDRIVRAMAEREEKIGSRLNEASQREAEADKKISEYEKKVKELDGKKQEVLESTRKQAEQEKKERMREARKDIEETRSSWRQSLEQEQETFVNSWRLRMVEELTRTGEKMLQDLADEHLEEKIIDVFLSRLTSASGGELEDLKNAKDGESIRIVTRFKTGEERRNDLEKRLKDILGEHTVFRFEQDPDLAAGIELSRGGFRSGWSVSDYLGDLNAAWNERIRTLAGSSAEEKRGE